MKVILSLLRRFLGLIIVFVDYITRPTPVQRSPEKQEQVENELEAMALYQFRG